MKRWAAKFREGEADVSDAPRSGRPRTATTDDNVALVQEQLAEDRRLTVQEISVEVEISEGSVWDILHHKLQKRKKCARWVPHLLTDKQRACPHQAASVVNQLDNWHWEVLGHPPYSPDLSPCDFHLFATLKEPLRGQ